MNYQKKPLSILEQIDKLQRRGLIVEDVGMAYNYLSNISYYRLRAYTYPFQNNIDEFADHVFVRRDIHFMDIIDLYCFDRRLRNIMFNAIEKIEIAVRAKIVQVYSESTNDSHWFLNQELYKDKMVKGKDGMEVEAYEYLMRDIASEIKRSNEDFIKHYLLKYDNPKMPPAWMTLEVLSLGTLSRMYDLLKKSKEKRKIAHDFGLPNDVILVNWLHSIAILRNCCAHHGRIWNRRFVTNVMLPYNTKYSFVDKSIIKHIRSNKFFAVLCCTKYLVDVISPGNDMKKNLLSIMDDSGSLLDLKDMGFPKDWRDLSIWK